jgi:phosphoglycerol transferase MdoB-like AlkP superfamily enzyme
LKILKAYVLFSALLLLYHAVFHILFLQKAADSLAWFIALRYAAATIAAAFFIPGLLYVLCGRVYFLQTAALYGAGIIVFFSGMILAGDLIYYGQTGKHLTVEFGLAFQNFGEVVHMVWSDYPLVLIFSGMAAVGFFYLWHRKVRTSPMPSPRLWIRGATVAGFILLSLVALRGGFQDRPMRPADAYQFLPQAQADFALNGIYTAFYASYHREDFPARSDAESIRLTRLFWSDPREQFIAAELPFYRSFKPQKPSLKKNVVFLILESWSARRLGAFGDKTGATPFFDSLAEKSWFFTQTFATGRRSIASLPSAVSSIPTLYGSLYITSPHEQNFQRGMGSIFAAQGYTTFFTYAAKAGSMGFNAFARLAGFENILTRESFPRDAPHDGTWGIYDHVMLSRVLADIDAAPKPVLSVVYTLHPHPPFTLPPNNEFFKADLPRAKYYNALRYSDNTLRDFFSAAEKRPWFKDTVFILMADHAFEDVQGYDAFHIPLVIYSPGFIAAKKDTTVASELDVLPTLIDLLHFKTTHASMGRSLSAPGAHFAYIDAEHSGGIVREKNGDLLAVLFGAEKYQGYFNMSADKEWRHQKKETPFSNAEMAAMQSYLGVMGHAIARNRIAPRPD